MNQQHPLHIENLISNVQEVLRLVRIHENLTGRARGRRHNVGVLNKSGLVLAVSCWEAFVEDLAAHAFDWLLLKAEAPTAFPAKVLTLSSRELREADDGRRVWDLAGTGWRTVLAKHKATVFERSIGRLTTPRPKQVDDLFSDLVGLASISSAWTWAGMPNDRAKKNLDTLVTRRGEIAHRVKSSKPVLKGHVREAADLVQKLSVRSSNVVREFLMTRSSPEEPWKNYHYGGIS